MGEVKRKASSAHPDFPGAIEHWDIFELSFHAKRTGNPFIECTFSGTFSGPGEETTVPGFYDGDGIYRIRFMPSYTGEYTLKTKGNFPGSQHSGAFRVTPALQGNHGPVHARGFHFEYRDGSPYYPVGTTCYVWELQPQATRESTLDILSRKYFNKIRFCVFPKHYLYNLNEPVTYPYKGTPCKFTWNGTGSFYSQMSVQPGNAWDFTRFNPKHFRLVEESIKALGALGIEADLILFHPYDRWGFSEMTPEQDELYLRYVIARFAAYRNVWWSLANEYDLLRKKSIADWENLAHLLVREDSWHHLRSIHNCMAMYDHTRPWITHCSIQRQDLYKCAEYTDEYRIRYGKPVILDEIAYEGDIDQGWGNISGEELTRRFWEAAMRGGYASHGETYDKEDGVLWWSHGGQLYGDSPQRLAFLHTILNQTPGAGLRLTKGSWDEVATTVEGMGDSGYYLFYYGFNRPCRRTFFLDPSIQYQADIIDTWEMTIRDAGIFSGTFTIPLPRKPWMAVRIRRIN